jgi:hypothetical protein
MSNALIYDIEIVNAIPGKNGERVTGITYCAGWKDHANMGVSVIGAFDYATQRYRVFCKDNFTEFFRLCAERAPLVTFNGLAFDNSVIGACCGVDLSAHPAYDILVELWAAVGLGPKFTYPTHAGFGLDAVCAYNFDERKTGNGALAPVMWQQGLIGEVIDYCLNDVRLTKLLYDRAEQGETLIIPPSGKLVTLRVPGASMTPAGGKPRVPLDSR